MTTCSNNRTVYSQPSLAPGKPYSCLSLCLSCPQKSANPYPAADLRSGFVAYEPVTTDLNPEIT